MTKSHFSTDYLVIGSGIAGLSFALTASEFGNVVVITKKARSESNTNYAQGGIAAAIGSDDSWELHYDDTLTAGAGLCHKDAVELLVKQGPSAIRWLQSIGAQFDVDKDAFTPNLGREGGHRRNRIAHHADKTGWEIERALLEAVRKKNNIIIHEHYFAEQLLSDKKRCEGAVVISKDDQGNYAQTIFTAKATVLATGGCGQAYLYTTNPIIATGDGIALAWRAGASIANMEFIQFHPTTLYHPSARSFLISEAVRGEGALLIRSNGERFMDKYHPMAELAPRDFVARAIDAELKANDEHCVYLDITHKPADVIAKRFPAIYEKLLSVGIDMTKEPIPVVPAAHYSCGGVLTDLNGRTNIENLYACGEVACSGVHGANRLASNSLLEALVFGIRSANAASEACKTKPMPSLKHESRSALSKPDIHSATAMIKQLRTVMWNKVGIVRTNQRLKEALETLTEIKQNAEKLFSNTNATPDTCELFNLLTVSQLIVLSAAERKESRGLHYTLDYPDKDDVGFLRDTILTPT